MSPHTRDFLITLPVYVLAVARLARLVADDRLLETPRNRLADWLAYNRHPQLLYLATCQWCLGIWLAAPVITYATLWPTGPGLYVAAALAASYAAGWLAQWGPAKDPVTGDHIEALGAALAATVTQPRPPERDASRLSARPAPGELDTVPMARPSGLDAQRRAELRADQLATPETEEELLARLGTDPVEWARAFALRAGADDRLRGSWPGGELHAWFARAIDAGRQEARRAQPAGYVAPSEVISGGGRPADVRRGGPGPHRPVPRGQQEVTNVSSPPRQSVAPPPPPTR